MITSAASQVVAFVFLIGLMWIALLASAPARTSRSVLLLTLCTALIVASVTLPRTEGLVVGMVAFLAPFAVAFALPQLVSSLSPSDLAYDDFLGSLANRLKSTNSQSIVDPEIRATVAGVYRTALHDLESVEPPDPDWRPLQSLFRKHIDFNIDVYDGRRPADMESRAKATENWKAVREEWRRVRARRARFWR